MFWICSKQFLKVVFAFPLPPDDHFTIFISLNYSKAFTITIILTAHSRFDIVNFYTRRPAIWIVAKYFYFWAINIVVLRGIWTHRSRVYFQLELGSRRSTTKPPRLDFAILLSDTKIQMIPVFRYLYSDDSGILIPTVWKNCFWWVRGGWVSRDELRAVPLSW